MDRRQRSRRAPLGGASDCGQLVGHLEALHLAVSANRRNVPLRDAPKASRAAQLPVSLTALRSNALHVASAPMSLQLAENTGPAVHRILCTARSLEG